MKEWYEIENIEELDSPALVVYPERVAENIRTLIQIVPDLQRLRPHVKTNKSSEVSRMMIAAGITKFKCATIAEAEMLAMEGAKDVLLAYQPVGPKAARLRSLVRQYPNTLFSCLIDNSVTAHHLSDLFVSENKPVNVFIDLNIGMNRTGIEPGKAGELAKACKPLKGLRLIGLHAYDGHIRDIDFEMRTRHCNESFELVEAAHKEIMKDRDQPLVIVAGGSPTFPIHAKRKEVECSPGTFIYWDRGYEQLLPEQPFVFAALVVTRVISKPSDDTLCVDLGHKSIASENPLDRRVSFLNAKELQPIGHSEEHMVLRTSKANKYSVGDVLYGVPFHICPTVALYEEVAVVTNSHVTGKWSNTARTRTIHL